MSKWIVFVLIIFITACSTAVPKHFFQLPAAETSASSPVEAKIAVYVAPVMVADVLNYDGIVLQTDDVRYVVANNNQWLTPLDRQLHQTLIDNLTALSDHYLFTSEAKNARYQLNVRVQHFNGRYDGQAVISGDWLLENKQGKQLVRQRFNLQLALTEDGYPALVRRLAQGWQQIAQPVAKSLSGMMALSDITQGSEK